jgi:hypothetical protein
MRRGGRLIKMSLPSVLHVCAVAAQASPGRSIHQGLAVEGQKVDINELTNSREPVC